MDPEVELSIEGRLLLPQGLVDGCVGVTGGRIVAVKKILEGETHYDMGQCIVVPAAVDMHVHFRDPGFPRKGDFSTESRAAAFGGVTTVADMPNTRPPSIDRRRWAEKLDAVRGRSFTDFSLYMGLVEGADPKGLGALTGLFKLYTAATTGDLLVRDVAMWTNLLAGAVEAGGRVVVHAEDQDVIDGSEPQGRELDLHYTARPPRAEEAAVWTAVMAAATTPYPDRVHIAHLSCREALATLEGSRCSAEVTPHHLFLDKRREDLRALGKVNPPLRTDADRAALWEGLASGRIPVLASDHAPHTREEKSVEFEAAPSGIPGVETMVPLAMAEASNGRVRLERLVDATAARPAAFLGLGRRAIEEGLPGHLAVYCLKEETKVRGDMLHHRCGWTPYEGMPAILPKLVVGPGGVMVEDGVFQQSRPQGGYVGMDLEGLRELETSGQGQQDL